MVHRWFQLTACCLACLVPAGARAEDAGPPLEKLIELNAAELFGAETTVKDGRVTLRFPGKGTFARAFATKGARGLGFLAKDEDVKDQATRKVLLEGAKGQFSVVGRDVGQAVSNFPLAGDFKASFRLRIPNMPPNAALSMTFHQQDTRNFLQVNFLREIVHSDGGKRRVQAAQEKPWSQPTPTWFDRKSPGVPFEVELKSGKLSVTMTVEAAKEGEKEQRVEIVSMDGISKPVGGKVSIDFRNLTYLLGDLVIEGGYEKGWAEKEVARLKKAGKLRTGEPELPKEKPKSPQGAGSAKAPSSGASGSSGPLLPPRRTVGPVDVTKPDPGAGEEL